MFPPSHLSLIPFSFLLHFNLASARYVDSVIPSPVREPKWPLVGDTTMMNDLARNSSSGERVLVRDVRILTVMSLMQQGWQLYEGHWFRLFELELQWIPAENFCRQLGAHLASIGDSAENEFVHRLRKKNNIWIGLNKLHSTLYEWSDGSGEPRYLNWDSTQPNEPNVHCVYMAYNQDLRHGTWFDYACAQKLPQYFACKLQL